MSRVQSIGRAFAVLEALAGGPLGVTGIAERARLPKSTVARLLQTLAAEGAVEQVADGTDYRIGERLAALAGSALPRRSLIALARPHLLALAAATGEASGLSVPEGSSVHYVDHQEASQHPVSVRDWTGSRVPLHAVSSGIVLLAHRRPEDVERYLARPLERFTDATMTDAALLRARIARARADGTAWTRDEVAEGISSVAAAIAAASGEIVAAVHVHGPSYRFPDPEDPGAAARVETLVLATAAAIAADLRRAG